MTLPYLFHRFYAVSLDPIHVGAGGYRIGRVDNTILREPGTQLPKIPGTSLAGVARSFTAMSIQAAGKGKKYLDREREDKSCAGKGGSKGLDHCGESNCPVCMTFGFSRDGKSFQGLAQLSDALIVFFPVSTMVGPVWLTSPGALANVGVKSTIPVSESDKAYLSDSLYQVLKGDRPTAKINLGWIYFEASELENAVERSALDAIFSGWATDERWKAETGGRIVLVSDTHFSRIVNSNLEVRTSVSINPKTGAAESTALFTYEAIPRGTILSFTAYISDPDYFVVPPKEGTNKATSDSLPLITKKEQIFKALQDGLEMMGALGVGGMNTRGMGRLALLNPRSGVTE